MVLNVDMKHTKIIWIFQNNGNFFGDFFPFSNCLISHNVFILLS